MVCGGKNHTQNHSYWMLMLVTIQKNSYGYYISLILCECWLPGKHTHFFPDNLAGFASGKCQESRNKKAGYIAWDKKLSLLGVRWRNIKQPLGFDMF